MREFKDKTNYIKVVGEILLRNKISIRVIYSLFEYIKRAIRDR